MTTRRNLFLGLQEWLVRVLARRPSTHRLLLVPGIEPIRWALGRLRAYRTFERSARLVPAYRSFLAEHGVPSTLSKGGNLRAFFDSVPIMDKDNYIRRYSITERCTRGRLPRRGVVVDESSGSSGTPTSWVRGPSERRATRELLQVGFARTAEDLDRPPFVINAFSLGAWATGMNVTSSLTDLTVIKSCGPDRDKIINTMREFGPHYTYVITSYPPFLKGLLEDPRLDWSRYDVVCAFGGEGISESMRDHILKTAKRVYGAYGASDLEINIAIETDFTIALRRAIAADPELSDALTRQREFGVLPSVFQFNPYDYLIETAESGELIITINRMQNINPRIRYNIHDRGHVLRMRDLLPVLRHFGLRDVISEKVLDLPILLHYGRSDLSVDYNGAVVPPDGLRDVINSDPELMDTIENHRLISFEDAAGDRQLHLALQLAAGRSVTDPAAAARRVFAAMRATNGDFHNAVKTCAARTEPTLAFYPFRSGVFAGDGAKLKNEYVWTLDALDAAAAGIDPQFTAER